MKSKNIRSLVAIAVLAVAALGSQAFAQSDSPAKGYFQQGIKYVQVDNLELAAKAFHASVESDPQFADAWLMLGATLLDLDHWEDGEKCLLKAIDLKPELGTHPDVMHMLAIINVQRTRTEDSVGTSLEGIGVVEADARRYFDLGVEFAIRDDVEQSTRAFLIAVRIDSSNAEAWVGLGLGLYDLGHQQLALRCLKQGLAIKPALGENMIIQSVLAELGERPFELIVR